MTATVRDIAHDTTAAIEFYERLGFAVEMQPGPGFAMSRGHGLRLLLNTPGGGGGAGQATEDGTLPAPGDWNCVQIEVEDIDVAVHDLTAAGVALRSGIIAGRGGRQAVADDPSGNPIELFEPADS